MVSQLALETLASVLAAPVLMCSRVLAVPRRQIGEGHAVVGQHCVDGIGKGATTTSRRKAAPFSLVVAGRKATWVNLDTRSMARNMRSCHRPGAAHRYRYGRS